MTSLTDQQRQKLRKIVSSFTMGLLNGTNPKGMCLVVCYPLSGYLSMCGYMNKIVRGDIEIEEEISDHYWIELEDDLIVDPTASQFIAPDKKRMIEIYIGKKPDWYLPDSSNG